MTRKAIDILLPQISPELFDIEGRDGFAMLWFAFTARGLAAPFGPVVAYGKDWERDPPHFYVAVFSRKVLPVYVIRGTKKRLVPVLKVETQKPYRTMLAWGYDMGKRTLDDATNCFERVARDEIPLLIQKRLRDFLGDDYPHAMN